MNIDQAKANDPGWKPSPRVVDMDYYFFLEARDKKEGEALERFNDEHEQMLLFLAEGEEW